MRFQLASLLYLLSLTAVSLAVFHLDGLWVAAGLSLLWLLALRGTFAWLYRMAVVLLSVGAISVLAIDSPTDIAAAASYRQASLERMQRIAEALDRYHGVHGEFPPAYVVDDQGRPIWSWRILILPYLEPQHPYHELRLDEPWDSLSNRPVVDSFEVTSFTSPRLYHADAQEASADYVAIVDPRAAWQAGEGLSRSEFADPSAETILVVEAGDLGIHWAEPRDLHFAQAVKLLASSGQRRIEAVEPGYFFSKGYGLRQRVAGMADGRARMVSRYDHPEEAERLITRSGLESGLVSPGPAAEEPYVTTIIHWPRIWGVAVWLALALLPLHPAAQCRIWPPKAIATETQESPKLPGH